MNFGDKRKDILKEIGLDNTDPRDVDIRLRGISEQFKKAPICKCGRTMVINKGNVNMWMCPSMNEKAKTKLYDKDIKLYHGTSKKNLKSIMKYGLVRSKRNHQTHRIGDSVYIYTSLKIEIAKQYGDLIIEINGRGLDLRVWETDSENQIMIRGDVELNKIKIIK